MKKLVLLHGWGVNSLIWQPILPELEKDFEVHTISLPGYGSQQQNEHATLDVCTADVLSRCPEQAIWVGWSLGGTIALSAALKEPNRIEQLILVSSTPKFLVDESAGWTHGAQLEPFEALADQFEQNYAKALKKFLLLQSNTNDKSRLKEVRNAVRELAERLLTQDEPSTDTLRSGLEILAATDLRDQLSNIEIETKVIAGQHDNVVPIAASQFLAENIPNASFNSFDSGHLLFLDQPAQFLRQLRSLAGVGS